jgi:hypothetical protein
VSHIPRAGCRAKGGERHARSCDDNLQEYLTAYLDGAGLRSDSKRRLFRTIDRRARKLIHRVGERVGDDLPARGRGRD